MDNVEAAKCNYLFRNYYLVIEVLCIYLINILKNSETETTTSTAFLSCHLLQLNLSVPRDFSCVLSRDGLNKVLSAHEKKFRFKNRKITKL